MQTGSWAALRPAAASPLRLPRLVLFRSTAHLAQLLGDRSKRATNSRSDERSHDRGIYLPERVKGSQDESYRRTKEQQPRDDLLSSKLVRGPALHEENELTVVGQELETVSFLNLLFRK